ncbi:MAG TPA: NAD-dependent epimerase/dehydratase family protein, partial [Solirubrobacteraceae bacterium]|nr:NAD-dependent epimerase/dehydratase family protein [Solirubrobacteraceae bacterium]
MAVAIVTGSGGLVGSESVSRLVELGYDVIGIENDMRAQFFGPAASTAGTSARLATTYGNSFRWLDLDIRDRDGVERAFATAGSTIELVVHAAAQPSHD